MVRNKKIKILQTIRQGNIGGGESHVLDLVSNLDKDRFESVVLSFTHGPMVDKLIELGIKIHVIETTKPFNLFVWPKVKKVFDQENFDILHAHGTRAFSNTFKVAKKLTIPAIYTVHGWSFHADQNTFVKNIRLISENFLVKQADKTICVSDSNLADGKKHFDMSRSVVIKNGINQQKFNPAGEFKNIREELGIGHHTLLVGFIARMTIQKDPFTFIKAVAKIPATENIKFLIVGDGDLKERTVTLSKELGVNERIIFLPFRQDIPDLLNAIDVYCLPSLWEGLSIALLEAMAMKKTIIATAVDGTKEVVQNEYNGLFIEPRNPDDLANAILKVAANKTMREALAVNAFNTITEDFNIKQMVVKIENIYSGLFAKKNDIT